MDELENGLGLEQFVRGVTSTEDASASSQAKDTTSTDEGGKTETPGKDAAAATDAGKKGDSKKESSPSSVEDQVRSKVAEALKGEQGKKDSQDEPAKGKEAAPDGGKEAKPEPDKGEQAKVNWDTEENPYRAELARVQDQLKNSRSWANELNKTNLRLQRNLERVEKKVDGRWTDEDQRALDAEAAKGAAPEDGELSADEKAALSELKGATVASLHQAYAKLGKEKTDAEIAEFDKLFKNNPAIMHRVTSSKAPIQTALKVLNEYRTAQKYGTTDLDELIEKVRTEAKTELEAETIERVTQQIMAKLDLKNKETGGIRSLRGSGTGREAATEQLEQEDKNAPTPIEKLFPG